MPTLQITTASGTVTRPLASTTLLGRYAGCTWPVDEARVPLFWLELRWARGWAWRVLAGDEQTRGPGKALPGGWRRLRAGDRIQGPGGAAIQLLEGGSPAPFAVDLEDGRVLDDEALEPLLEPRDSGLWPVDAEGDARRMGPLADGEVFRALGRVLRFHAGQAATGTVRCVVDLASPDCELSLGSEDDRFTLTLLQGDASVRWTAEAARALLPYVEARQTDMPPEGWLELSAAHLRWQDAGGNPDSGPERIGQDRSRITRALTKQGVANASSLFETRRRAEGWVTRITLAPDRLYLD